MACCLGAEWLVGHIKDILALPGFVSAEMFTVVLCGEPPGDGKSTS